MEWFVAMQHSRGCTRDCQRGRMRVHDVDLRKASGMEEDRCFLCDGNTCSHLMGKLCISALCNSSWGLKRQKGWSLLVYSIQNILPELSTKSGSIVKAAGADRKGKEG